MDISENKFLAHYGVMGQKKGVRRWQNKDMSLTPEGRIHYGVGEPRGSGSAKERAKEYAKKFNDAEGDFRTNRFHADNQSMLADDDERRAAKAASRNKTDKEQRYLASAEARRKLSEFYKKQSSIKLKEMNDVLDAVYNDKEMSYMFSSRKWEPIYTSRKNIDAEIKKYSNVLARNVLQEIFDPQKKPGNRMTKNKLVVKPTESL